MDSSFLSSDGIPAQLKLSKTSKIPGGMEYVGEAVGIYKHTPIPNNQDVFTHVEDADKVLFWQGDGPDEHWRYGGLENADPSTSRFGCGLCNFWVPMGAEQRYSSAYEAEHTTGITFTWIGADGSWPEELAGEVVSAEVAAESMAGLIEDIAELNPELHVQPPEYEKSQFLELLKALELLTGEDDPKWEPMTTLQAAELIVNCEDQETKLREIRDWQVKSQSYDAQSYVDYFSIPDSPKQRFKARLLSGFEFSPDGSLKSMDLGGLGLTALPESFGNLSIGGDLLLCKNQLTALPESFGSLKVGRNIDLSGNKLARLPESVGNMEVIGNLDLSGNKLASLPETFGNMKVNGNLDLSSNEFRSLCHSFGALEVGGDLSFNAALGVFNSDETTPCSLPASFGNVQVGGMLNLYGCQLPVPLPDSFGNLRVGGTLNMGACNQQNGGLPSLPDSFAGMQVGGDLDMCGCDLELLPDNFGKLKIGGGLRLDMNKLKALPESFGSLGSLTFLTLSYMGGEGLSLPDSFGYLEVTGDVNMNNCGLKQLPDSFGNLRVGGLLKLDNNKLSSLPESFGKLRIPGDLALEENPLVSLPSSFGDLEVGGSLNLYSQELEGLCENFGKLTVGRELYVGGEKLKRLSACFGALRCHKVYINSAQEPEFDETFWSQDDWEVTNNRGLYFRDWMLTRKN